MLLTDTELQGQDISYRLAPLPNEFGRLEENLLPFIACQGRTVPGRDIEGLRRVLRRTRRYGADYVIGVRIADFDFISGVDLSAPDPHAFANDRSPG